MGKLVLTCDSGESVFVTRKNRDGQTVPETYLTQGDVLTTGLHNFSVVGVYSLDADTKSKYLKILGLDEPSALE